MSTMSKKPMKYTKKRYDEKSIFLLWKKLNISSFVKYFNNFYKKYFLQLTTLMRNVVEHASAGLKQVIFSEETGVDNETDMIKESLTTGTNLFELYLALQSFSV